ncbi:hypothetical protein DFJ63DRAFT_317629 [Scheffersomyces coipomensis]|uniref:uncharacterized protein n=1 Tax=Scheffersomyces coipomensis TaxID=1788519 RepID=UPI00315E0253
MIIKVITYYYHYHTSTLLSYWWDFIASLLLINITFIYTKKVCYFLLSFFNFTLSLFPNWDGTSIIPFPK